MKNTRKKILSILLVVLMLIISIPIVNLSRVCLGTTASAAKIASYSRGDIIEFGWYPQSKVTDSALISSLNSAGGQWVSYNYYSGTGNWDDGKMTPSDYMRYKDVMYGSNKYRGVVFDSYRPHYTGDTLSSSNPWQHKNGYYANTVYWFKYDSIKWRVLDPATGMMMSETILDSQPYNNYILYSGTDNYGFPAFWGDASKTYYVNNYAESTIRQWLNNDFYNTAFSKAEQDAIMSTTLDNSAFSDSYSAYASGSTNDKIYLLSFDDSLNTSYGFSDSDSECDVSRMAKGSDYAKSQGLNVDTRSSCYGNSDWLLRSAGYFSSFCCNVFAYGVSAYDCDGYNTIGGVRPVLNINLTFDIDQPNESETPEEPSADCSCNCHKSGFMGFIWKIINFFNKLFKSNKTCACGVAHY